jgi:hypothetical protein
MNHFDCQKMTSVVFELASMKQRVDTALNKMEPVKGVLAAETAKEILGEHDLLGRLGLRGFEYLVERFGNIENLKKNIMTISVGGKSRAELEKSLYECRANNNCDRFEWNQIFESIEFIEMTEAEPQDFDFILLSGEQLDFATDVMADEVINRAKEYGLALCPREAGLCKIIQDAAMLRNNQNRFVVASRPIKGTNGYPAVLTIDPHGTVNFHYYIRTRYMDMWRPWEKVLFCVPRRRVNKIN